MPFLFQYEWILIIYFYSYDPIFIYQDGFTYDIYTVFSVFTLNWFYGVGDKSSGSGFWIFVNFSDEDSEMYQV